MKYFLFWSFAIASAYSLELGQVGIGGFFAILSVASTSLDN